MKMARFALVAALLIVATVQVARACPGPKGHRGMMRWPEARCAKMLMKASADHLKDHLGVSADQMKRIDAVRYNFLTKAIRYRASLQQHALYIKRVMSADAPDQAKVLREMRKARGVRGLKMEEGVKAYLRILKVFTPDQRDRFRKKCRKHHGQGPGKGYGHRGPGKGYGHRGPGKGYGPHGPGKGYGPHGRHPGKGLGQSRACGGHGQGHGPGQGKGCSCSAKGRTPHK